MKTKVVVLMIATLLTGITVFSQSKTTFGVKGGINFFNITGKDAAGDKFDNKIKTGFDAGVNAEIPIGIDFFIQPGLLYNMKGTDKLNGSNAKLTLSYLEIPVNLIYKPELGKGKLLLGFGPYAAFGVGGSAKNTGMGNVDVKFKNDITTAELTSGDVFVKPFDAGANFLFGYECSSKLSVQLDASLGLVNISPKVGGSSTGGSPKNTGFGVSLGYRF